MNAIEFLKSQHREVEALFQQIESLGEKAGKEKKAIFEQIALKLETHAKIEEKLFYPEGEEIDKDTTLEAYEEHDVVRDLIRKISKTKPNDESFMAKITVLKEVVQHHVEEEEKTYFPECKEEMPAEHLEELGAELEETSLKLEAKAKPRKSSKASPRRSRKAPTRRTRAASHKR